MSKPPPDTNALLLSLHQRMQRADTLAELGFFIANDSWQLVPFRQAFVFLNDAHGHARLTTVTGLVKLDEKTPFTLWLHRMHSALNAASADPQASLVLPEHLPTELRGSWQEWWPEHVLRMPIHDRMGQARGCVYFVRDNPWLAPEVDKLSTLAPAWGYCAHALRKRGLRHSFTAPFKNSKLRWALLAALVLLAVLPVRLSAIAQAEIIALSSETIAAPLDGVIKSFLVEPNTHVKQGQALFTLDDAPLRNQRRVAEQALAVAIADAHAAQQKSFSQAQSKAELASLLGKVREKQIELKYLDESLQRTTITAPFDGIAIYSDPNDWLGKPVVTGERVAQLAQPKDLGVMMWLPVADAISLEPGAELRVFLQVSPLESIRGELVRTSYQANVSPDGVSAYPLRGKLDAQTDTRIGLRGVAKVYGERRPLIYWVLRRPMGSLRQWLGL